MTKKKHTEESLRAVKNRNENKKLRKKKKLDWGKKRKEFVHNVAANLRENTPKSELWFYDILGPELLKEFQLNTPLGLGIPDLHSKSLRIVIEIDGSIHWDNSDIKKKDAKRTIEYQKFGYNVFRINHLDEVRALEVVEYIKKSIELRKTEALRKQEIKKEHHTKTPKKKKKYKEIEAHNKKVFEGIRVTSIYGKTSNKPKKRSRPKKIVNEIQFPERSEEEKQRQIEAIKSIMSKPDDPYYKYKQKQKRKARKKYS